MKIEKNIKKQFLKYFISCFLSAFIPTLFGACDSIVIGRFYGPVGSSAIAVCSPIWSITFFIGVLFSVGGAITFTKMRSSTGDIEKSNRLFSLSLIYTFSLVAIFTISLVFFDDEILTFFGGDVETLPIAKEYLKVLKFALPIFACNEVFYTFTTNDGHPLVCTLSVSIAGTVNIILDILLTIVFKMGALGAGIASASGSVVALLFVSNHMFSRKNTIKFVAPANLIRNFLPIVKNGFSSSFNNISMCVIIVLFNNQIMKFLGGDALSVYGVLLNVYAIVVCVSAAIGYGSQPFLSTFYGTKDVDGIKAIFKISCIFSMIVGAIAIIIMESMPKQLITFMMDANETVLKEGPNYIRIYSIAFLFMPFNVFMSFFFPSAGKPMWSIILSIFRGIILPITLIYALPAIFGGSVIWLVVPIIEFIITVYAVLVSKFKITEKNLFINKENSENAFIK